VSYRITIDPAALRELKKLDTRTRQSVANASRELAVDPRPEGVQTTSGSKDSCRIRSGDYRVRYRILDRELIVLVVKVAHRRDAYRKSR
jgi:mRNA interferase RelE/StbE